jgi:hypothetical protein
VPIWIRLCILQENRSNYWTSTYSTRIILPVPMRNLKINPREARNFTWRIWEWCGSGQVKCWRVPSAWLYRPLLLWKPTAVAEEHKHPTYRSVQLFEELWFLRTYYALSTDRKSQPSNYKYFDRLCGLVVRVTGFIFRGPVSIPGATRFSEK